jgi:2-polyprenyl-3-methyl-5-hydroxy-6-metoxy-1,4-benzoquinol methylase
MDLLSKDQGYYAQGRDDIMSLIPPGARIILDVGCGKGILGKNLSAQERRVCGIEKDPIVAEEASKHLETVVVGDVESLSLPFAERSFDCLIFADILEHLKDPWAVLRNMRRFLREGGEVIASIPNVRHYKIIRSLLRGHWRYTQSGILDITHLRFFTLEGIRNLFEQTGYTVEQVVGKRRASGKYKLLNVLAFGRLEQFLVKQYLIVARKQEIGDTE